MWEWTSKQNVELSWVEFYFYSYPMLAIAWLRPRLRQNGPHIPDDIFKFIFFNEKVRILIEISLSNFQGVQLTIFQHWFR